MDLELFAGQDKSELSMIEVARAILETRGRGNEMYFSDLVNAIQTYLEKSDSSIREALPFFYTDLNTDGSFIPLGENKWGLRSWYAIDEIDEEIINLEELDEEGAPKRTRKRVNAFIADDEDAIDYNDDDPEDDDYHNTSDLEYGDDNPDDEKTEVDSYDSELNEIIPDDELDEDVDITEEDDDDYSEEEDV